MVSIAHVALNRDSFGATLTEEADGTATLKWNDYVVNEWTETFPSFALGLMRLAALDDAVKTDRFFNQAAENFTVIAGSFLELTSS